MALSFNEYILNDALYFNLTGKHQRDRDFIATVNNSLRLSAAPFGYKKKIFLFDSSKVPYPTNFFASENSEILDDTGTSNPWSTGTIYEQVFDSEITIDDNGTRANVKDDKMYFNTVMFSAQRSGTINWFAVVSNDTMYNSLARSSWFISDSVGIPGTNSLLTVSTSTVTTSQSMICWFNLSIT